MRTARSLTVFPGCLPSLVGGSVWGGIGEWSDGGGYLSQGGGDLSQGVVTSVGRMVTLVGVVVTSAGGRGLGVCYPPDQAPTYPPSDQAPNLPPPPPPIQWTEWQTLVKT